MKKRLFTFRCWPPAASFFFPPVFRSLKRHDPFKWLFTCIRRRAKALLNELLSTIQLEWPSQQHSFSTLHNALFSLAATQAEVRRPKSNSGHTCGHEKSHYMSSFGLWGIRPNRGFTIKERPEYGPKVAPLNVNLTCKMLFNSEI